MQTSGSNPAASLGEEINAGKILLELLQREQEHLIHADLEALTAVTAEKEKAVARMTELALQRHRTLLAAGFEASENGMQHWIGKADAAAAKSWNELLEIARQAKEANRVNGMLISQHMARNQNALNVLQGNPQGGNMYGPDGQTTSQPTSRTLVVG
jgi:flagella synthesis protein FlgN